MNDESRSDAPEHEQPLASARETPLLLPAPDGQRPAPPAAEPQPAKASPPSAPDSGRRNRVVAIVVAAIVVLLAVGWFFHHRRAVRAKEESEAARDRIPTVSVIAVRKSGDVADLLLPGSVSPVTEASLYARASGYLARRYVDIGDPVKKGQLLAEIDAPDLDQQVAQGRAAVAQARQQVLQAQSAVGDARARVALAQVTYQRLVVLVKDQAVAEQDVDQARQTLDAATTGLASATANVGASEANVRASEANAQRLAALQDFEKVRAPFDGIVTARSVDVGSLIGTSGGSSASATVGSSSASTGGSTGSGGAGASSTLGGSSSGGTATSPSGGSTAELFRIAQVDRLRVYVSVPQDNAAAIVVDTPAAVLVQGLDRPVDGRVTRTARSLDPNARTMLVEVQVDNARRLLTPGMYAQVRFRSPRSGTPLLVPGEAIIARANGSSVAIVEDLRPEDRQRLPKNVDKAAGQGGDEGGDSKGGDKGSDEKGGDKAGGNEGDDKAGGNEAGGGDKGGDAKGKPGQPDGGGQAPDPDDGKPVSQRVRRLHLQQVQIGRDYGTEVEITQGLDDGATIVANPGDDVAENALVLPKRRRPPDAGQGKLGDKSAGGDQSPSMKAPTKGK